MMPENPSELQGTDWFSRLKNPQGSSYETGQAEGLGNNTQENLDNEQPQLPSGS